MAESLEELQARHKKELKALDGEKRASVKKAKATSGKGKKAKDAIAEVEQDYDNKLKQLQERHTTEAASAAAVSDDHADTQSKNDTTNGDTIPNNNNNESVEEMTEDQKKIEKARRKREKQKENKRLREQALAEELANAGPSPRDMENDRIMDQLRPLSLAIKEIDADGNCLYRAVAANCDKHYTEIRNICADILQQNEDGFAPFCEYTDNAPDYAAYVEQVRNSSEWGGHLELRALSIALKRPVVIYSAQSKDPIIISETAAEDEDPIRLSFHLHYYSLGEHYNQVLSV